jgi:hypothetical protein
VGGAAAAFSFFQTGTKMELSLENSVEIPAETESRFAFRHRPVDLAHLSRYTLGNNVLEHEVLELFRRQTRIYFDKLSRATNDDSWREAARVLKASARGVGAWQILQTAEEAEQLASGGSGAAKEKILRALDVQIREANQFIESVL